MSEWCGWPVVDDATSWENAQQILTDAELSDGLNVGTGHFFVRQNHTLEPGAGSIRRGGDAMVAG